MASSVKKILMADDYLASLPSLVELVEMGVNRELGKRNAGWAVKVQGISSAEEALYQLVHCKAEYDLLMIDYEFGDGRGMNGIDVIRQLRETGSNIPVILRSGAAEAALSMQSSNMLVINNYDGNDIITDAIEDLFARQAGAAVDSSKAKEIDARQQQVRRNAADGASRLNKEQVPDFTRPIDGVGIGMTPYIADDQGYVRDLQQKIREREKGREGVSKNKEGSGKGEWVR